MQDLTQMSNEQLWELFPIVLEPHNPAWKMWYEQEAEQVCRVVGRQNVLRLSHIGSTSVPGLLAKPTVDILLEVRRGTDLRRDIWALAAKAQLPILEMRPISVSLEDVFLQLTGSGGGSL